MLTSKLSRLRDLKGKRATGSLCFGYVSVANQDEVTVAQCRFLKCMGLFVLAYEVLFSAYIGQSRKILLCFTYFECGCLEEQIHPRRMGAISHTPRVRAYCGLIGLGCSFKNGTTEIVLFC